MSCDCLCRIFPQRGKCLPPGMERLICIVGTDRGCVRPKVLIATSTSVSISSVAWRGTASSWHSVTSLIISALQVRLYRLQLRVGNRHRIAHDACCLWLLINCNFPFAIVGRRTPRLSPPVALALQVCDRESLRKGRPLHVLLLSIVPSNHLVSHQMP